MPLEPSKLNGLKRVSLLHLSKITTIDKNLILGKLGELNQDDVDSINNKLIEILKL